MSITQWARISNICKCFKSMMYSFLILKIIELRLSFIICFSMCCGSGYSLSHYWSWGFGDQKFQWISLPFWFHWSHCFVLCISYWSFRIPFTEMSKEISPIKANWWHHFKATNTANIFNHDTVHFKQGIKITLSEVLQFSLPYTTCH